MSPTEADYSTKIENLLNNKIRTDEACLQNLMSSLSYWQSYKLLYLW